MTIREFADRYGLALGVLAVLALVIALLPGNAPDREQVAAGLGDEEFAADGSTDFTSGVDATASGDVGGDTVVDTGGGAAGGSGTDGGTGGSGGSGGEATDAGAGGGNAPQGGAGQVQFGAGPHCADDGRQIGISPYMPPCVQWTGTDNGGATSRGVTGDQIKIAIWFGQEDPATRQVLAGARLNDTPPVVERMYEALRRYYNNHYQTYGREVVFVPVTASGESTSDAAMKADAVKIAEEIGAFASFSGNALAPMPNVLAKELAQRGVICICTTSLSSAYYNEVPPLIWSSLPTIDEYAAHAAEYAAKRLGFNQASFGGVGTSNAKRVYCLMYLTGQGTTVDPEGPRMRDVFTQAFARRGINFKKTIEYFYDPGSNQDAITNMIGQFKNAGCTTIVPLVDPIMPILITKEATKQLYFPEWFIVGTGLSDTTTIGRFYDQQQWEHAFGISPLWVTWDRVENSSGYHEFHHGMPGRRKGDEGALVNVYRAGFQTLWTGIHMAGPNLTPKTFEQGMYAYPKTGGTPANPLVFMNRKFPTAIKDFSEVWWDPNRVGPDERTDTGAGMMVRADGGRRYDAGEWPQSPPSRRNGVTVTAAQGVHTDHYADGHTHKGRCLSCSG